MTVQYERIDPAAVKAARRRQRAEEAAAAAFPHDAIVAALETTGAPTAELAAARAARAQARADRTRLLAIAGITKPEADKLQARHLAGWLERLEAEHASWSVIVEDEPAGSETRAPAAATLAQLEAIITAARAELAALPKQALAALEAPADADADAEPNRATRRAAAKRTR